MKLNYLNKNSPPGMSLSSEIKFAFTLLLIAICYSFGFILRFFEAYNTLFDYQNGKMILDIYEVMPSFRSILGDALIGFLFASLCMIACIIHRYAYYRQGSKAIYLMKRLPDRFYLHKTALKLPLIAMLLYVLAAVIMLLIYMLFYELMTPKPCLIPIKTQILWRM